MVLVQSILGIILLVAGILLFRAKRQRVIGSILCLIGGALVGLGIIALLSFHPL